LGLIPEDVAGVARLLVEAARLVTVTDGTPESSVGIPVAPGPEGQVEAGDHTLTLPAFRSAEERYFAILGPGLARVVLCLLSQFLGPARVEDTLENLTDERLLVPGEAADGCTGNGPVVRDMQAQRQPAVALLVPVEAHRLFLPAGKGFVQ